MSLTEVYDVVQAAWTEGRLENVLQRQKELAHLHSVLTKSRPELMLASSEGMHSPTTKMIEVSSQINAKFDA